MLLSITIYLYSIDLFYSSELKLLILLAKSIIKEINVPLEIL